KKLSRCTVPDMLAPSTIRQPAISLGVFPEPQTDFCNGHQAGGWTLPTQRGKHLCGSPLAQKSCVFLPAYIGSEGTEQNIRVFVVTKGEGNSRLTGLLVKTIAW